MLYNMRMTKNRIVLVIILTIIFLIAVAVDSKAQTVPEQCQYSERPLVDGQCDNSDPSCPENIKNDGGNCVEPEAEVVVEQPKLEPAKQEYKPTDYSNFVGK